jgi:hypothetical protein
MKLITRILPIALTCLFISSITNADSLPIGISLNQSGAGAQHSLDFKNGIEAYFNAANDSKKFGKYKFKLIAMDDNNKKERAISNVKRLISSKKVLALLSDHTGETQQALTELAINKKTAFLTSSSTHIEVPNYAEKYVGYLNVDNKHHISNSLPLLKQATHIYLVLESKDQRSQFSQFISSLVGQGAQVSPLALEDLENSRISDNKDTLFVIGDSPVFSSIALKHLSKAGYSKAKFLILPDSGATRVSQSIAKEDAFNQFGQLYFLNSVPLHLKESAIVKAFQQDMNAYNARANTSHQAFKGYLLAYLMSEGIYKAVKDIKTDSIKDLVTLPFQVLDKVVGWVAHAGDSINKSIVVESLMRINNLDLGLQRKQNFSKDRILLNQSWITQSNKRSSFMQATLPTQK